MWLKLYSERRATIRVVPRVPQVLPGQSVRYTPPTPSTRTLLGSLLPARVISYIRLSAIFHRYQLLGNFQHPGGIYYLCLSS